MTGTLASARWRRVGVAAAVLQRLEFAGRLVAAVDRLAETVGRPGQATGVRLLP
jgi:hypothetical protein